MKPLITRDAKATATLMERWHGKPVVLSDDDARAVKEIMLAARYSLFYNAGYLSAALTNMQLIPTYKLPAPMGVDNYWRCYYRPDIVQLFTLDEIVGVLVHEVWHLLRRHGDRAAIHGVPNGSGQEAKWLQSLANIAMDCTINPDTLSAGYVLPPQVCLPETFGLPKNKAWEEYYLLLRQIKPDSEMGKKIKNAIKFQLDVGSGSDGAPHDWEADGPAAQQKDGKTIASGLGEIAADMVRQEVARKIAEHHSKDPGNIPGGMVVWSQEELRPPKICWKQQFLYLARTKMTRGLSDYSYARRNRRQPGYGRMIMPGTVAYTPKIACIMDTSGSMTYGEQLVAIMSELKGLMQSIGAQVQVISTDAGVHTDQQVQDVNHVVLRGGGGTDMGVGLQHILDNSRPLPNLVVTFTDGYTPWPETYPLNHICVMTTKNGQAPSFGTTIIIDED